MSSASICTLHEVILHEVTLCVGACGAVGARTRNDDHYLVGPFVDQEAPLQLQLSLGSRHAVQGGFLCAVADGMGGYEGGAFASRVLLETLAAFSSFSPDGEGSPAAIRERVEKGIEMARSALAAQIRRDPNLAQAGSTLAGLIITPGGLALPFHLGDSRILRAGAGFLRALTIDHAPLAAEVAAGRLDEAQAAASPHSSQVSRSFGAQVSGELEWGEPLQIAPGDTFLLLTDGCHGLGRGLSQAELRELVASFESEEAQRELQHEAQHALALARQIIERAVSKDGSDNATVVVLQVQATPQHATPQQTTPQQTTPQQTTPPVADQSAPVDSLLAEPATTQPLADLDLPDLDPFST